MRYLVLQDFHEEGLSEKFFDTRTEADEYLYNRTHVGRVSPDDFILIEFTQIFDVGLAVQQHAIKRQNLYEQALMKLSDEEIAVLGLSKA